MSDIYQRIDGSKYQNIYIVGDLHGCYNRLMTRLGEVKFSYEDDLLISVGDLIDRGPDSLKCLSLIDEKWFEAVRGNHEQMAIEALFGWKESALWSHNGGGWYSELSCREKKQAKGLLKQVTDLPFIIELATAGKLIVVAHADYPENQYGFDKKVNMDDVVWSRKRFNDSFDRIGCNIDGADQFYFGHTPLQKPVKVWNQNYIDTGAVFGNLLTLVQVQDGDGG